MGKRVVVALFVTLFSFVFLNFVFLNFFGVPFSPVIITGYAVNDTGIVQIFINGGANIFIYSPENISYDFNKGDLYIIGLNVSADFSVDEWRYSLYDLAHSVYVEQDVPFTPNSSITAVRWGNLLNVFAHETDGNWYNKSVIFYVNVSNSAPLLGNISDPIFACEASALSYRFNATDLDEEDLIGDISPKNPFYLASRGRVGNVSYFDIISGILDKGDVAGSPYTESISVLDPWDEIDIRVVDIEVIEVNNLPVLEDIGAQTVWLAGDNSTFSHVVDVVDVEDGNASDGNLRFNLTWGAGENLFDVGFNDGLMNYTPVPGHEGSSSRVYSLEICVEDNPLSFVHQNISVCSPLSGNSSKVCDNFTLTVTNNNRAPQILNHSPTSMIMSALGTESLNFNVFVYDADGTIPDIDWYVDGVRVEHNENVSSDSFSYAFGCGVGDAHNVRIVTSDGLLNDSRVWIIDVEEVDCPPPSSGGGGGGGAFCIENWVCDDWNICQNVKRSFESRVLSLEDYSVAKERCFQNKEEDDRFCGFHIRDCYDLNSCGRVSPLSPRPLGRDFCYYTENPSCTDEITNCHDGGCEVLTDCGGPCAPCATCSDKKQNQGEKGVDCGGPCPFSCEPEVPYRTLSGVLIVIAILLLIIIFWILWRLYLLWKNREKEEKKSA